MLITALLSGVALATTYTVDFPIVQSAPTYTTGLDSYIAIQAWDVASGVADQVIASSWSYITCEIQDEAVVLVFEAPMGSWPTSFPATVTCSGGGHSLVAVLTNAPMNNDYDKTFTPSVGLTIAAAPNVGFGRTYKLPVGPSYVEGSWIGKLTPTTNWTGIGCTMVYGQDGTTPYLQVSALTTAAANSGYCVLHNGAGVPYAIALTITR